MAYIYDYFYINHNTDDPFFGIHPVLLTLSKIRNGFKGETQMHMHSHLELFYFESGNGKFICNDTTMSINAHTLLIINAKNMHLQFSDQNDIPLVYYSFSIDNLKINGFPENTISSEPFKFFCFSDKNNPIYKKILELLNELKNRRPLFHTKSDALFIELLIDSIRLFQKEDNTLTYGDNRPNDKALIASKAYIESHFYEDVTLEDIVKVTFIGKSYFRQLFKNKYGISPMRYLNVVRIENAKLLLTKTQDSITEIGLQVGFNNPTYFSETFLKIAGMTPRDYRKTIKTKGLSH